MSKKCIYQSNFPDFKEVRCAIPLTLRPQHLEKYYSTECESNLIMI